MTVSRPRPDIRANLRTDLGPNLLLDSPPADPYYISIDHGDQPCHQSISINGFAAKLICGHVTVWFPRPRLKPGEKYSIRVNFRDPQWFVIRDNEPLRAVTGLSNWSEQFRLCYRPPAREEYRQLRHAAIIWHGSLPSRAFTGGERVD